MPRVLETILAHREDGKQENLLMKLRICVGVVRLYARTRSMQETINRLFYSPTKSVLDPEWIEYVVASDGTKYYMSGFIDTIRQVQREYVFEDIRETDIVVDVGACIGGFSIPASRKARRVYALEPLTMDLVRDNIQLNGVRNIELLAVALGDGTRKTVQWRGRSKTLRTTTLAEIKELCGGCDFLKVDCEGAEWSIRPEDLDGIRRVEMEVHEAGYPFQMMREVFDRAGFTYRVTNKVDGVLGLRVIHAENKKCQTRQAQEVS